MYQKTLQQLRNGNEHFAAHHQNPAVFDENKRRELTQNGQHPYAVIITCGDSRVPPEHIFSAGLGDLFVIRNAGNLIGSFETGSAEYAAEHLKTPLIVVLGHTHCGAVHAALHGDGEHSVRYITDEIKAAVKGETDPRACEWINARNSVKKLLESPLLSDLVKKGELAVLPAVYDIETGIVAFEES
ncbi:MAG: carbonic anhydrase [Lachnospiraceae bacterium]|nr:carbonic anhydrase [Lachnospiraceae bacterium]